MASNTKQQEKIVNHLEIDDPTRLRTIFQAMTSIMDETNVEINDIGIIIRGMPSSHVALVDAFLPKEHFILYEFKNLPVKFRIKIDQFLKILSKVKTGDKLYIGIAQHRLNLIISTAKYTKEYQLSVMEFNPNEDKLPKYETPIKVVTNPMTFKDIIDDVSLVSEFLVVNISINSGILFSGSDDLRGVTLKQFGEDDMKIEECWQTSPYLETFQMFLLSPLVAAIKGLDTQLIIRLGNKKPMLLHFEIKDFAKVDYYLVPLDKKGDNQ